MRDIWEVYYQLVPPNLHRQNAAKRSICTFKAHFLPILTGIAEDFPQNHWDILVLRTEIPLNILRQSILKLATSEWENFNGPTRYNHTPLWHLGSNAIMHKKTNACHSWYFHGKYGWNVWVSLEQYWCYLIDVKYDKAFVVSNTVEFRHHYLTQPTLTHAEIILNGINIISCALIDAPTVAFNAQLRAITEIHYIFQR